jgi:hypothetical protein
LLEGEEDAPDLDIDDGAPGGIPGEGKDDDGARADDNMSDSDKSSAASTRSGVREAATPFDILASVVGDRHSVRKREAAEWVSTCSALQIKPNSALCSWAGCPKTLAQNKPANT